MAKVSRAAFRDQAQGFGLLSDPTRLGILSLLAKGPKNVTALCKALGSKQPAVSHHLGLLRMGRIITALLKYPRDGAMQTEYSHLHEIVAEALRLYDHRARTSDVDIRVDVPTDIPVQHPGQLMEVLANLIKNSLDAMPEGGELSIRGNNLGHMVEITVADTGPGIPEDIREKVFHPFFSTKGEGQGCGLGLSICRDILERHGGEISLVPSDRGAVFLLRAPLDERFGQ